MTDPLFDLLDGLPSAQPDAARADRIRARCRAALDPQRRRVTSGADVTRRWPRIVLGFGVLYVTALLHQVLALYGLV